MAGRTGKIYYSITEVAEMASVKPHVLRYWETEFPGLAPRKNRAGNRTYRDRDVQQVLLIRRLLHEDGYTIKGARRKMREKRAKDLDQIEIPFTDSRRKQGLTAIRKGLEDILETLSP
ncbi:MAG: MerR family transcriptional regulator [Gemmatimonadota bacterium]|jgi:DNA-binding transcriptional MerR regulator|nr:transcriptional regulator [Gemmatimonadota bacterium]MDP6528493.1 MerR family transcriptional regulator [Gemmatimonadota bacterium]MDP6801854.1 MerR family transcriptional regulator [Gemmatimonadota bacterium]MDP7031580.1 MerR family transcriptional regulator [Gemmatimonadota bacterium]